jgi:hypothetical protein
LKFTEVLSDINSFHNQTIIPHIHLTEKKFVVLKKVENNLEEDVSSEHLNSSIISSVKTPKSSIFDDSPPSQTLL